LQFPTGGLEVVEIGEDLDDLAGILGGEAIDKTLADFVAEKIVETLQR